MSQLPLPKAFFITGTDTDVGKTLVSAILVKALKAAYWKPVQSGGLDSTDTDFVRRMTQLPDDHFFPETYRLTQPLSPHASARIDGIGIELDKFRLPESPTRPLIVEGAGGVMVPLNDKDMVIDLICKLGLPVLLVTRSALGTINHTTLTLEALRSRGISVLGVVMNGEPNRGNREAIEYYGKTRVLAEIPPLPAVTAETITHAFDHFAGFASSCIAAACTPPAVGTR